MGNVVTDMPKAAFTVALGLRLRWVCVRDFPMRIINPRSPQLRRRNIVKRIYAQTQPNCKYILIISSFHVFHENKRDLLEQNTCSTHNLLHTIKCVKIHNSKISNVVLFVLC